jgi:hypothetical protein
MNVGSGTLVAMAVGLGATVAVGGTAVAVGWAASVGVGAIAVVAVGRTMSLDPGEDVAAMISGVGLDSVETGSAGVVGWASPVDAFWHAAATTIKGPKAASTKTLKITCCDRFNKYLSRVI